MYLPRSNFRRLYAFSIAAGLGLGIVSYGLIRVVERASDASPAQALLLAMLVGLVIGLALCVAVKLTLRQNAYDLYNHALDITNSALPIAEDTTDEIMFMRQTFSQAFAAIPRGEDYPRLAGDLVTARDLHAAIGVTVTHLAERMPIQGAALLLLDNERHQLFTAATWGKIALSTTFTIDARETAIGRALQEQRSLLYSGAQSSGLLPLGGGPEPPALFCLPLLAHEQPLGVLCLAYNTIDLRLNEEQKAFARGAADLFTMAIDNLRAQQLFARESARLNAFDQLNSALESTEQIEQALAEVLRVAAQITDSEHGTLLLLEADETRVRHRITLERGQTLPINVVGPPVMKHGLAGWAIRERRADIIEDTERDTRWLPVPGLVEIRSVMVVPLLYGARVLAVLTLAAPTARHYSRRGLAIVTGLTAYAVNLLARMESESLALNDAAATARRLLDGHLPLAVIDELVADQATLAQLASPQTRSVVVVYTALRGLDQVSAQLTPEQLFEQVLMPFLNELSAVVFEHNGYLEQRNGVGVLAVFGFPQACDNETERACEAALAIQATVRRLRLRWRQSHVPDLHVGVALVPGTITLGITGPEGAQSYTMVGAAIQGAERLQSLARKDEVLLTLDLFGSRPLDGAFRMEALEPLAHGEHEPSQQVYRLLPRL